MLKVSDDLEVLDYNERDQVAQFIQKKIVDCPSYDVDFKKTSWLKELDAYCYSDKIQRIDFEDFALRKLTFHIELFNDCVSNKLLGMANWIVGIMKKNGMYDSLKYSSENILNLFVSSIHDRDNDMVIFLLEIFPRVFTINKIRYLLKICIDNNSNLTMQFIIASLQYDLDVDTGLMLFKYSCEKGNVYSAKYFYENVRLELKGETIHDLFIDACGSYDSKLMVFLLSIIKNTDLYGIPPKDFYNKSLKNLLPLANLDDIGWALDKFYEIDNSVYELLDNKIRNKLSKLNLVIGPNI